MQINPSKTCLVSGSCQWYQTGGWWLSSDTAPQTTTHLKPGTPSQRLPLRDGQIPPGSIITEAIISKREIYVYIVVTYYIYFCLNEYFLYFFFFILLAYYLLLFY